MLWFMLALVGLAVLSATEDTASPVSTDQAEGDEYAFGEQSDEETGNEAEADGADEEAEAEEQAGEADSTPLANATDIATLDPNTIDPAVQPLARSLRADYTRKTQRLAEREKLIAAWMDVTTDLEANGIDPRTFREALSTLQSGDLTGTQGGYPPNLSPYGAQETTETANAQDDVFERDPDLLELNDDLMDVQAALEEGTSTRQEEAALRAQERSINRSIRQRKQEIKSALTQAQDKARQDHQSRVQTLSQELTHLKANPYFKPILDDPQKTQVVTQFALQTGMTLEEAAGAKYRDELIAMAYATGNQRGRTKREEAKGASLQTGRSAASVKTAPTFDDVPVETGLAGIWNRVKEVTGTRLKNG